MNIYEKLQTAKTELRRCNLSQSGKAKGTNGTERYTYFELDDFLPSLEKILLDLKLATFISFTREEATITLVNWEEPSEKIVVSSPFGSANLNGCHEVQNIGAVETYQRRYLYQALFDIAECDALNGTEIDRYPAVVIDEEFLEQYGVSDPVKTLEWIENKYGKPAEQLTERESKEVLAMLQKKLKG